MDHDTLVMFLLTQTAMALSPGPAVLLIMSQGARHGLRGSALGGAGIELGNTLWFALSAFGLTTLLLASAAAFAVVKWAGAAYLVWLGIRLVASRGVAASVEGPMAHEVGPGTLLRQGMLTQLANPKAMIFFGALLPQFIDPARDPLPQFALLGAITMVNEYLILLGYGWVAAHGARLAGGAQALRWFDRVAGTLLLGAGARLALVTRF